MPSSHVRFPFFFFNSINTTLYNNTHHRNGVSLHNECSGTVALVLPVLRQGTWKARPLAALSAFVNQFLPRTPLSNLSRAQSSNHLQGFQAGPGWLGGPIRIKYPSSINPSPLQRISANFETDRLW